ncbi:MAG: MarR family transcriptional regulator [Nocardia sp.]|nr:MarR family transcriptional regulator [Nocardia sp.]
MTAELTANLDAARLARVISPLRRTLLTLTRNTEHLPDIPDAQIEIIRALSSRESVTSGELARRLGLNRSTVSNLLTVMEAETLIERRPHPGDRRRVEIRITARARDLFARFDSASGALVADAVTTLSRHDRDVLAAALPALERLREALARTTEETHEQFAPTYFATDPATIDAGAGSGPA